MMAHPSMKPTLLEDDRVETWKVENPREWWAFTQLDEDDELRNRVLLSILNDRDDDSIDELVTFAEAAEAHQRAAKTGHAKPPPGLGERRSFPIIVNRMARMQGTFGPFFRVAFTCSDGWGGYFDTTNPGVVERISRLRNPSRPLTIVGEAFRQPYDFYVELAADVRIV